MCSYCNGNELIYDQMKYVYNTQLLHFTSRHDCMIDFVLHASVSLKFKKFEQNLVVR